MWTSRCTRALSAAPLQLRLVPRLDSGGGKLLLYQYPSARSMWTRMHACRPGSVPAVVLEPGMQPEEQQSKGSVG